MPVNLSTGQSNYIVVTNTNTSNARIALAGNLTNPTNNIYSGHAITLSNTYIAPTSQAEMALANLSSSGPLAYTYVNSNNGTEIVQSLNNQSGPGVNSAPGIIGTIENALNTSFFQDIDPYFTTTPDANSNTSPQYTAQTGFQNTAPLISSSANPTPNSWHGGVWSRGGYADNTIDSTISGGGGVTSANASIQTQISGFQVGIDGGLYNIQNSRFNVVFGLMGVRFSPIRAASARRRTPTFHSSAVMWL